MGTIQKFARAASKEWAWWRAGTDGKAGIAVVRCDAGAAGGVGGEGGQHRRRRRKSSECGGKEECEADPLL